MWKKVNTLTQISRVILILSLKLSIDVKTLTSIFLVYLAGNLTFLYRCALFFVVRSDGSGLLSIIQFNEYKNVELLGLECEPGPEEFVRQHVAFQYGALKSKTSMMEGRLQDIAELVRAKNPSLLLQIQKTAVHSNEGSGVKRG